jgi:hypothetical protein
MEFVKEVASLEDVKDAFKDNLVVFIKKKYLNLSDLWYFFQDLDLAYYGDSKYQIIEHYYGKQAVAGYKEFFNSASYSEFPGVLKVQARTNEQGISEGIVPTNEYLNWHRDGPAYRKVYKTICLHGKHTVGSSTSFLETVSEYYKLSSTDKQFVDSLKYEYRTEMLLHGIQRLINKNIIPAYPSLLHKEILLNYIDNYSDEILEQSLIRESMMKLTGFGYDYNTAVTFKGKNFKESLEITKWLKSLLFKEENVYKHQWHDGDLVFFDSICTQHSRDAYQDLSRLLHRIILNFE